MRLTTTVSGIEFASPICAAAGMDKDATRLTHFDPLGFGAIEVGSITLRGRPRGKTNFNLLFAERAIINNMGAHSQGAARVRQNIRNSKSPLDSRLGINLIPNLDANEYDDIFHDLFRMIHLFRGVADYYVVNISSPNMKDLRELQDYHSFSEGLAIVNARMTDAGIKIPLYVKFGSDITEKQTAGIVKGYNEGLFTGVVIGNSSLIRPNRIQVKYKNVSGGLSGAPIADQATSAIAGAFRMSEGEMPIIGCGGVMQGHDVYEKIVHGASLVQLHSAMYVLPVASKENATKFVVNLNWQLSKCLERDGFKSVEEAVGTATQHRSTRT